jgi:LemA protein
MEYIIGLLVLVMIYSLFVFNKLIKLNNLVKEGFATMDTYLKARWDLIPNLTDVTKAYAAHEKETFEDIVKLRNNVYDNIDNNEKIELNSNLSKDIEKLIILKEAYPELKANENFLSLSNQLTAIEDNIANARKYYNAVVRMFNSYIESFPSNLIAKVLGYKVYKMFEANKEERDNVKVNL